MFAHVYLHVWAHDMCMFDCYFRCNVGWWHAGIGNVSEQQQRTTGGECTLDTEELVRRCHQAGENAMFVNTIMRWIM